jgi:hypothetical protein
MIPIFFQLNADKDSSYLLRETMRRTVSQRDKVGFCFDGLPPVSTRECERAFLRTTYRTVRTHAGGGIDGIETAVQVGENDA